MKETIAVIACLAMFGSAVAQAQDSMRNAPPASVKRAQQGDRPAAAGPGAAPVGHRQPRPGDLPPETGNNDPDRIDAQDRQLDRMIKGICKGC